MPPVLEHHPKRLSPPQGIFSVFQNKKSEFFHLKNIFPIFRKNKLGLASCQVPREINKQWWYVHKAVISDGAIYSTVDSGTGQIFFQIASSSVVYRSRCAHSANTRCARSAGLNTKLFTKCGILRCFLCSCSKRFEGKWPLNLALETVTKDDAVQSRCARSVYAPQHYIVIFWAQRGTLQLTGNVLVMPKFTGLWTLWEGLT